MADQRFPGTCAHCGEVFYARDAYDQKVKRYCGQACYWAAMRLASHGSEERAEFVCATCGATYHRATTNPGKYCSRPCYDAAQSNSLEALFEKCDQSGGPNACWPWLRTTTRWGYGKTTLRGRHMNAHRAVYQLMHGDLPRNIVVMHLCDNRLCINPTHLQAGTQKENIADMDRKGRRAA